MSVPKLTIIPAKPLAATYDAEQEAAWRIWWDTLRDAEIEAMRAILGFEYRERLAFRAGWHAGRAALNASKGGGE